MKHPVTILSSSSHCALTPLRAVKQLFLQLLAPQNPLGQSDKVYLNPEDGYHAPRKAGGLVPTSHPFHSLVWTCQLPTWDPSREERAGRELFMEQLLVFSEMASCSCHLLHYPSI